MIFPIDFRSHNMISNTVALDWGAKLGQKLPQKWKTDLKAEVVERKNKYEDTKKNKKISFSVEKWKAMANV